MSGAAVATMVLVGGFIWGGFVMLVARAVRREAGKSHPGEAGSDGG